MDRELTDNLAQIAPNNEVPVYDVETEKALLSICIRDKAALDNTVSKRVVADEFSDQRNALIYEAITKLYLDNGKIDRYNICDQLEKDGKLAQHGNTLDAVAALVADLDEDVQIVTPGVFMERLVENCGPKN